MNNLTQELQQQAEKHLAALDDAKELLAYFGAMSDGQKHSHEEVLQAINNLFNVSWFIKSLCDNAEALQLENDELKAQ